MTREEVKEIVTRLAEEHNVHSYEVTYLDYLAFHFTRLNGNYVPELDQTQLLILALRRAGHLGKQEAMDLQFSYLKEK